jgi:hypothetical protein
MYNPNITVANIKALIEAYLALGRAQRVFGTEESRRKRPNEREWLSEAELDGLWFAESALVSAQKMEETLLRKRKEQGLDP